MTRDDLKCVVDNARVSNAAGPDYLWPGFLLEPRLWEALRIELQARYRRSTGEAMAVLSVQLSAEPVHVPEISTPQQPMRWLPIELADKSIDRIYDLPGMARPIGNSEEYWCRDADGRVFLAAWADDKKRAYWWDLDGESPVDPVEFMPHPLDRRWVATTEGSDNA